MKVSTLISSCIGTTEVRSALIAPYDSIVWRGSSIIAHAAMERLGRQLISTLPTRNRRLFVIDQFYLTHLTMSVCNSHHMLCHPICRCS